MHLNELGGRAPPGPAGGTHRAPPDPLAVLGRGGAPRNGREMEGKRGGEGKRGRKRNGKEGRGWEKKGGKGRECVPPIFTCAPDFLIPGVAPEASNVHLTKMRSVSLIRCLPKMPPSSSTSTGSQIATWKRRTRHEFGYDLLPPSTGKIVRLITSVSSLNPVQRNVLPHRHSQLSDQTLYNDFFEVYHKNGDFITKMFNGPPTS